MWSARMKRTLTMDEKITRWEWNKEKWTMNKMIKTTNLLLKSGLLREKNGIKRVNKKNLNKVKFGINENSMIAHQCLSNIINDRLMDYDAKKKIKLKTSDKKLIRQIDLNYKLFYNTFKESN